VRAKVRVVDGRPADFSDLWCQGTTGVVVVGREIGCMAEVGAQFGYMAKVVVENLVERRFLPLLLLAKDVDSVL
jgi:hypothetical protein